MPDERYGSEAAGTPYHELSEEDLEELEEFLEEEDDFLDPGEWDDDTSWSEWRDSYE